jgi:hypothetical protein
MAVRIGDGVAVMRLLKLCRRSGAAMRVAP